MASGIHASCEPFLCRGCVQDKAGRPLIYYRAALQDFSKPEQAVKYLVRRHIQCSDQWGESSGGRRKHSSIALSKDII